MAILFISDLHLSGERPDIVDAFLDFLNNSASNAEALYILGDLFEVWIGDDAISSDMESVIKGLASLTSLSIPVYVMTGNRDFLLGKAFAQLTGCTLIEDPLIIDLYGTPTLLMHGDTLCTDDTDYQQFRNMVRNPKWQQDFLSRTVEERAAIAKQARKESTMRTSEKPEEIMDANAQSVIDTFRKYPVSQIIHGHTHRPAIHQLEINGKHFRRIVLGDWYTQASVLKVENQTYELTPNT